MTHFIKAALAACVLLLASQAQSQSHIGEEAGNLNKSELLAQLPTNLAGQSDFMCLAIAVYHEARGESFEGQKAVASVILQRVVTPGRWGRRVCEVVRPVQFSFLDENRNFAVISEWDAWAEALHVATIATVEGPDPWLESADHYHTKNVSPSWNQAMPVVTQIGSHIFYADPLSKSST